MNRDEIVRVAVVQSDSFSDVAQKVGISRQTVMRIACRLGLDTSHFPRGRGPSNPNFKHGKYFKRLCSCGREMDGRAIRCSICARRGCSKTGDRVVSDESVRDAVKESDTYLKAANRLGVTRQVVNRVVGRLGLDISHFRHGRARPYTDAELFRAGHVGRVPVRSRFYKLNPSKYFCSICRQEPEWNGLPLRLEVDHINGDRTDNRLENLRWLCPHCHSQQPTFKGLNYHRYGNKRKSKKEIFRI